MARFDQAYTATDKRLKEVERLIRHEYGIAIAEVEARLYDYMRRFKIKDKKWRQWVKEGKYTQKQYTEWKIGQMAVGKRWEEMRDKLAKTYVNADRAAYAYVNDSIPWIFAENINYQTYAIEKGLKVNTSFTLYSEEAVKRLMVDDPELLPPPGKKVSEKIRTGKAVKWNRQQIQSVMVQGIIQGKTIPAIAKHLAHTVGDSDYKAAIRNARTMTTAAQNAGRLAAMERAESMGIELMQQWIATLDDRTRHSHRDLDGEVVPVGSTFSNGLRYPADPMGPPSEVYNCRCTMIASLDGYTIDASDLSLRNTTHFEDKTYADWKTSHVRSDPIDKQDQIAAVMKDYYTNVYRGRYTL